MRHVHLSFFGGQSSQACVDEQLSPEHATAASAAVQLNDVSLAIADSAQRHGGYVLTCKSQPSDLQVGT